MLLVVAVRESDGSWSFQDTPGYIYHLYQGLKLRQNILWIGCLLMHHDSEGVYMNFLDHEGLIDNEKKELRLILEKKRELVLILHDILASRRDYVASSAVRSYFYLPGVSCKSATTTFDNKSYSRTVQKSEDITVDTTASGKHSIRFSFGRVRKTDDSSTSRPSFKWKISNRTSYYGKQLPGRTQPASFLNSIGDGEKRFKAGKPTEFSQRW